MSRFIPTILGIACSLMALPARAQFTIDIEKAPFQYSETPDQA